MDCVCISYFADGDASVCLTINASIDTLSLSNYRKRMSEPSLPKTPPAKILLGTDLSPRSDRALDRAAQLARQWNAELLIVHAIDRNAAASLSKFGATAGWRQSADPVVTIQNRIRRDLREPVERLKFDIREGEPEKVLIEAAEREGCELMILGESGNDLFEGLLPGSTVDYLVRKSPVSVLVVKTRPRGAYQHLLVGTDFTEESRHGLEVAAHAFSDSRMTLMHAYDMPYQAFLSDTPLSHDFAAMERSGIQQFINESNLPSQIRSRIRPLVEHGPPGLMMGRYVEQQQADLTVIGAYGRGFLFHLLGGANTLRIVDTVPGDILLVRAQR